MKRFLVLLALLTFALPALAQIGEPVEVLEASMAEYQPLKTVLGYFMGDNFKFDVTKRGGVLYSVSAAGPLNEKNIPIAADLIGYASGYGEGMAEPVAEFFSTRIGELSGQGEVPLGVEQYFLTVNVTGEAAPYEVSMKLELVELDSALFPAGKHVIGPADAKHVIREFSDLQCPFCARFSNSALPLIKERLLSRGDVRFEFHHFPLVSIHANAFSAAEASECITAANGAEAFWSFHDALFARQQAWSNIGESTSYFLRLAQDVGLSTEGVEQCLNERQFADEVQAAYDTAGQLGIRGTPTVYVNGFKVGDFNDVEGYIALIELSEKFAE